MHRLVTPFLLPFAIVHIVSAQGPIAPLSNLPASQAHVVLIDHTPPINGAINHDHVPRLLRPSTPTSTSATQPRVLSTEASPPCSNLVYCFVRPCQFAQCPNHANAVCEDNYCGGCFAVWRDAVTGLELTDADCNNPIASTTTDVQLQTRTSQGAAVLDTKSDCTIAQCLIAPCQSHDCPAFPDALCIDDYCNGCNAIFVHADTGNILTASECRAIATDRPQVVPPKDIAAALLRVQDVHAIPMAQDVEGNFDNFDVIESENGSRFIAVSEVTIVVMFVVMVCVLPLLYYWYYNRYIVKQAEQKAKRAIFHGLKFENERSDDEFVDSDDKIEPESQNRVLP